MPKKSGIEKAISGKNAKKLNESVIDAFAADVSAAEISQKTGISEEILDRVAAAIKAAGVPGVAALEGSRLAQHWIEELEKFDSQYPTIAVEVPFFIILEKFTVIVGVQDRIAMDGNGLFGCEWKTTKGTTRFWNEDKWLAQISTGPQISVYGLGQHEGYFVANEKTIVEPAEIQGKTLRGEIDGPLVWHPQVKNPRVLVRAITKEDPPNFWGVDPMAFFEISKKRLDLTREALLIKADQLRAARARGTAPWQLTGLQCMDRFKFGAFCRFHEECLKQELVQLEPMIPTGKVIFSEDDPGTAALAAAQTFMRVPLSDPRVVILGASAYSSATDCMELYRREGLGGAKEDPEIDKGTALHAAVAEWYRGGQK